MGTLLEYCRIFRWHSAPGTITLLVGPYLAAGGSVINAFVLGIFAWLMHGISFGHNSLMDTAMGYDLRDPSKKDHPLVTGRIELDQAHKVIHWGTIILAILGIVITCLISPVPFYALVPFLLFVVFGNAYNSGLSKVSQLGLIFTISISFAALGTWGWFLASPNLGILGVFLVSYIFLGIVFQNYSSNVKELEISERSNLLARLGAKIIKRKRGHVEVRIFNPRYAKHYGWGVKLAGLSLGGALLYLAFSWQGLISLLFFGSVAIYFLHQLTKYREYIRGRELLNISLEEIATILLPVLIVVPLVPALVLIISGVAYFFVANHILWGKSYPKV